MTSKNHQGGLADSEDHSDKKIFVRPGSSRCPVETIQSYLSHLNLECSSLFQKARNQCKKLDPAVNTVWYAACPVGHNTLENLFRDMTSRAGIDPPMTNHCIRATSIAVLSAANVERCHIKAITGHRSETSIQSYCRAHYPISSKIVILHWHSLQPLPLQPPLKKFLLQLRVLPRLKIFTSTE